MIEKFVWGKSATEEADQKDCNDYKALSSAFVAETQNLLHFHRSLLNPMKLNDVLCILKFALPVTVDEN